MKNARVTFNLLDRDYHDLFCYKEIICHLIFDFKMELTSKDRYVAGVHLNNHPFSMTYASVVSCGSVRLAFLIVELNDLDILSGNTQNAYLNAPTKEKVFLYDGDEWKSDQGEIVIVVRAIYGLNSSALAWRNHLSEILGNRLVFQSSLADTDAYFKEATDKTGDEYYTYILFYVDDLMIFD